MEIVLKTEQKQILSQRMILSAKVLQLTSAELETWLIEQATENPVMELTQKTQKKSDSADETEKYLWASKYDTTRSRVQSSEDDVFPEQRDEHDASMTLTRFLLGQINTKALKREEEKILRFLIDCLDERGYFTDSAEETAKRFSVTPDDVEALLRLIRQCEPVGVGAANLADCLCMQLRAKGLLTPVLKEIIENNMEFIAKKKFVTVAKRVNISVEEVKKATELISSLNPKPAASFGHARNGVYITPEIFVRCRGGTFEITLNDSLCHDICVSREYIMMCDNTKDEELKKYLTDKIRRAEWIKQCVEKRNQTLTAVVAAILKRQEDFFRNRKLPLKPLTMTEVAEEAEVHASTVSRAINGKYLQCAHGVFPLKYFFAKGMNAKTGGEETAAADIPQEPQQIATDSVRDLLRELIDGEDKKKPYSDRILAELLTQKGVEISRRTVAKYREQIGIPGASERKAH